MKRFENLEVWKLARELCNEVFQLTLHEAFSEDFGLKDQIRNSGRTIMDNIAESFERDGNKEFGQFLAISKISNLMIYLKNSDLKGIKFKPTDSLPQKQQEQ